MRATQQSSMMDTCVVMTYNAGITDTYGNSGSSYIDTSPVICGYKPTGTREVQQGNETVMIDGELRLPIGTTIKSTDRIRLVTRYGEAITPLLFSVVGQPAQGPSGIVVKLRKVTDV
ncbi:MAG: hypothetical protein KDE53_13375 [Caldilineaceae bacterium]|nr:hypothetical protein [Caldilineaceae bacterium]